MIPFHRLIATASLATIAVALLGVTWADDQPPAKNLFDSPPTATDMEKLGKLVRDVEANPALRKQAQAAHPFVSLEDRLKFDGPGRERLTKMYPALAHDFAKWRSQLHTAEREKIPPATLATLLTEQRLAQEGHFNRTKLLASLHQVEVEKFVTNPGFGHMRMIIVRPLNTAELPPKDWSEGDRGESVTLPKTGSFFMPNPDKKGPTLPSLFALGGFHTSTTHAFIRPDSWGLVKDKKHVAGFLPHSLESIPDEHFRRRLDQQNPIKDKAGRITDYPLIERWAVRKVELIGLLMHESPVAYLNPDNKLPTMADVKDAKTRPLTDFESGGLKDLAAGKDVVVIAATTNQIRMVGAIRMAEACLKCHDGNRGDLLGGFSYDLVRDPAFIPSEK